MKLRLKNLPDVVTGNWGPRVIALLVAVGLWIFVNAGQHEAQISLDVPISYRDLPADMMIVNQHPGFVDLQVSGPRTLLSLLDPGRLTLRLDLTGVSPGQASFKINPESFSVPRQTMVTRVSPSQIVLDVDRVAARDVPVHLVFGGSPPSGYTVAGVELKPSSVMVSGPSRELSRLDPIATEPFDLKGVTTQLDHPVSLVLPPGPFKVATGVVEATVRIEEVMGDREFRTVAVEVRDPPNRFRLSPNQVSVTVHGPLRALSGLNLDGMVYVDASDALPGTNELPVEVDLPQGLQVVRAAPEKVKLRILTTRMRKS
ncbi:MAG: CdaR family protein [Candidatus Binataceae bacterium]